MIPPSIIPDQFERSYPPSIIAKVKELERWGNNWTTLTLRDNGGEIQGFPDNFAPHALSPNHIIGNYDHFDIVDLINPVVLKERVFRVNGPSGQRCVLKIARFHHELPFLERELRVYHKLMGCNSSLAPKLIGYAYEEDTNRVVGFLVEEVAGTFPSLDDLKACETALQQLHGLGIVHGDINRYNIFMTDEGPKFIDFEVSTVEASDDLKISELESLRGILSTESDLGRPYL